MSDARSENASAHDWQNRRPDSDIRHEVQAAIHADSAINSDKVVVHVTNGIVTLSGRVGAWIQQRKAEDDARAVPGVVRIDNNLEANG